MKPTSVIFLIISVLLACVGVLLMVTAGNMADTQGVSLFVQTGDEHNNYSSFLEFDGESIRNIELNLSDVDVNIIGHAEKNRVELVNFPDGTYDFYTGKTVMKLNDTTAITNLVDIDNLKINFNGFRDYLHYFKYRQKTRTVNLYLTDDAAVIRCKITAEGSVSLKDLNVNSDWRIKVPKGNITLDNVKTDSSVTIDSTDDSNITLNGINVNDIEINGVTAFVSLKKITFARSLYVNILSGDVEYSNDYGFNGFNVLLRADSGIINVGENRIINGSYTEENYIDPEIGDEPTDDEPEEDEEPTDPPDPDEPELLPEETEPAEEDSDDTILPYTVTVIVSEGNITVY